MSVKIKANDDRISATAIAVLLISRTRISKGVAVGLISPALASYRGDYDGFKADYPKRDLAATKELGLLPDPQRREHYQSLRKAMDVVLARIERNRTEFNSLLELDNFLAFNLKAFD
jgi:hypothetical protein